MKHARIRAKGKSAGNSRTGKLNRVGLTPIEEYRLRRTLRRSACSETWVDAQIASVQDSDSDGNPILYRFFNPGIFPPGGRSDTAMRWCRFCGRYTPAHCIHLIEHRIVRGGAVQSATLQCDDCRLGVEAEIYCELYEAGLYLRPAGSMSFVRMRERLSDRMQG